MSSSIPPSPAVAPTVKSEGAKASGHVNGKPSISSVSKNPPPPNGTTIPASSATQAPSKPMKMDIHKLFQGSSSGSAPTPPSDMASPSTRPMNLPAQQQHHPSQQPGQQSQLSQPSAHNYIPFSRGPSQQPNSGPGRGPPPGSPVYSRQQLTNGTGGRPPGGPNGPGPQMPNAMASPRMGPHPGQQQPGMPPPSQMSAPPWPAHYVSSLMGDICFCSRLIILSRSTHKIRICSLTTVVAGMCPDPRCRINNFLNTISSKDTPIHRPVNLVNPTQGCRCLPEPNLPPSKDQARLSCPTQYPTQSIRRRINHLLPTRIHTLIVSAP